MKKYLFIYGLLKKGCSLSYVLDRTEYLGQSYFTGPFKLYQHQDGYPCLIETEFGSRNIFGEVYLIRNEETLYNIDRIECHPKQYKRCPVVVQMIHNNEYPNPIIAESYFFQKKESFKSTDLIETGSFSESKRIKRQNIILESNYLNDRMSHLCS